MSQHHFGYPSFVIAAPPVFTCSWPTPVITPLISSSTSEKSIKNDSIKDDTPFFKPKNDQTNFPESKNHYNPCTPYPSYGWTFPHPQYTTNSKKLDNEIPIEEVEELETEVLAELDALELQESQDQESQFQVKFNVQGFTLNDIKITRQEKRVLIEGKQAAKTDKGAFIRTFTYVIDIPEDVNLAKIQAIIDDNGQLCIRAPKNNKDNNE